MGLRRRKIIGSVALAVFLSVGLFACGKKESGSDISSGTDTAAKPATSSPVKPEDQTEEVQGVVVNTAQASAVASVAGNFGDMESLCQAAGIAAMADGTLLITDIYNKVIWRVKDGIATIYAGAETVRDPYGEPMGGYNDGDGEKSYFASPWAIAPFFGGWAVSDTDNNAVRLILGGKVQTVNGQTTEKLKVGELGVIFDHPTGLAADGDGNLYVSDTHNGAVRKITTDGMVSTLTEGLEEPTGLCCKDGALYIAETEANRILKYEDGRIEVVAGCGEGAYVDGAAQEAAFVHPQGVVVGNDGAVYVADTGNSAVRKIKDGEVTTVICRDRTSVEMDLVSPVGLLLQGKKLYVCDSFTGKVLQVILK